MSLSTALVLFPLCLAAVIAGSMWLSRALHDVGTHLQMLPGLLGLIAALGADSPEIFSAVTALQAGEHEVGMGVVLGSNLFNLAALMGLAGVLSEPLPMRPAVVLFNGAVSLVETALAAMLVLHWLTPAVSLALMGLVLAVYVAILWVRAPQMERLRIPNPVRDWLAEMVADVHVHADRNGPADDCGDEVAPPGRIGLLGGVIAGSLVLIVAGSIGMVHSALRIVDFWPVPRSLVGVLILAGLTGLPNAYTAVGLARRGQGSAVVSETLNSNTINILVGVGLPALVFGVTQTRVGLLELAWLLGLTALATVATAARGRLSRGVGLTVIGCYAAFIVTRLFLH